MTNPVKIWLFLGIHSANEALAAKGHPPMTLEQAGQLAIALKRVAAHEVFKDVTISRLLSGADLVPHE